MNLLARAHILLGLTLLCACSKVDPTVVLLSKLPTNRQVASAPAPFAPTLNAGQTNGMIITAGGYKIGAQLQASPGQYALTTPGGYHFTPNPRTQFKAGP